MTFHRGGLARAFAWAATALSATLASSDASAFQITRLTPQGEVAQVRQVVARFDEAAIRFGDARAADPITVACSDVEAGKGTGRWNNEKEWVFEFTRDLPPGVRCSAQANSPLTSVAGQPLKGTARFEFSTGGPFVSRIRPTYGSIDEEQVFILQLNGPATAASIAANVWCKADTLGERIPVKAIDGKTRDDILKQQGLEKAAAREPLRYPTLACNRALAPSSKVQLVFGSGVATPSGIANKVEKRFNFEVREPFEASFSCERENAQAACLPLRPMRLQFSAPVARSAAKAIVLKSGGQSFKPELGDDEDGNDSDKFVSSVRFKPLFPEQAQFTLELPKDLRDDAGRTLRNAANFPLKVATGAMPPLAKFAAAPFGIVERFAEPDTPPLLPITLRKVEGVLPAQTLQVGGRVNDLQPKTDADIIAWLQRVKRYDEFFVARKQAAKDVKDPLPPSVADNDRDSVQSRMVSLLKGQPGVKAMQLPKPQPEDPRPFEVVGIPLAPGFHVLEVESQRLGNALLDEKFGAQRNFYVRTSALVTNLGVHFKLGRDNAMAWVTTLDKGKPVTGATVQVSDCRGKLAASGTTDANGVVYLSNVSPEAPRCGGTNADGDSEDYRNAWFVSARSRGADGVEDIAFAWSDWQRGIEPWRFNAPTSREVLPDVRVHTVLDRNLLRAGETVSMKHVIRNESRTGFATPADGPGTMTVTHTGTGQAYQQPLVWRKTATGGLSAESTWAIPPAAKLGVYEITLSNGDSKSDRGRSWQSGSFRVEEFRLPVMQGRVAVADKGPLVDARKVAADVQLNYVAGGAAANLPVRVSALVRARPIVLRDYDDYNFSPPRKDRTPVAEELEEEASASQDQKVVANRLPATLDRNGTARVAIPNLPASTQPQDLLIEATYNDPSGEVQTLRGSSVLWPAAVMTGIKAESWTSVKQKAAFQAIALDLSGKPQAGVKLDVRAIARIVNSSRKRLVGGFYSYDNQTTTKDLGSVCSGSSDARGVLVCNAQIEQPGEIELVVTATDGAGKTIQAASSIYITRAGEMWFGGDNNDRMDVLAEKKAYEPGETARFQVRMPFRFATALVAIEREGIIETRVVELNGKDPSFDVAIQPNWSPNVYVSVLALRGRLREVPWYSFFTWGFKAPREWWTAFWYEGREYVAPTALVDLSKPAYRLGMSEIRVGHTGHQIKVAVKADKDSYPVRGQAQVTVSATLPDGKPAANAEVALAAVDQALEELSPNTSWNLLEAMLQRRAWGVETSTAQMEIIGRRHYGRKAVAAGGGGGRAPTRELLDTLLLWNPKVQLDAQGQAKVTVPLNDALTSFKIVAVADSGAGLFGTGQTQIRSTQDLQIISGLPPLVREDDQFRALITLRNTSSRAMKVEVTPRATLLDVKPQTVDLAAGASTEVAWNVTAPPQLAFTRAESILWEIQAREVVASGTPARDGLKVSQRIVPSVPVTVQQATLVQVDGTFSLPVQAPPATLALDGAPRGGLRLNLQPKLADGMPGVRDWFAQYPYSCLEQKTSKAIGLRDAKLWQTLAGQLPSYLDGDGLAYYFPPTGGDARHGSDTLTAYLLAASAEASQLDPTFTLPADSKAAMERGLIAFVEGRITRSFWSPRKDLDMRKLAALSALARNGKAKGSMLASITVAPNQWPTDALIHWVDILKRVADAPQRDERLKEAMQILRARLTFNGTRMGFSTEADDNWWWLMSGADANAAKLMLAVLDDPGWKDDMGRLATGLLARQQRGAWGTTTANLWGSLAIERFSKRFETATVTGKTTAANAAATATADWARSATPSLVLPWAKGNPADKLTVAHQGAGKPWLTLQSLAAVPVTTPFSAGYQVKKTVTPVEQAVKGSWHKGDVVRVSLEITATADMTWVVISDPIPGGATVLGGGLGRDSEIATASEKRPEGAVWPTFEERSFEGWRGYYEYLPKGTVKVEYTFRLNNAGDFALPPTRAEAMYAPEVYGVLPNSRFKVDN